MSRTKRMIESGRTSRLIMEKDFFTSHRAMVAMSVSVLMSSPFSGDGNRCRLGYCMNPCRVMVEYRVVSGIGQIIIGVDIALLILSRYCLYNDSCISPDPAFNYLVNPASQLPDLQDSAWIKMKGMPASQGICYTPGKSDR